MLQICGFSGSMSPWFIMINHWLSGLLLDHPPSLNCSQQFHLDGSMIVPAVSLRPWPTATAGPCLPPHRRCEVSHVWSLRAMTNDFACAIHWGPLSGYICLGYDCDMIWLWSLWTLWSLHILVYDMIMIIMNPWLMLILAVQIVVLPTQFSHERWSATSYNLWLYHLISC